MSVLVRTIAYEGGPDGPEMERVELLRFGKGEKPTAPPTSNQQKNS